ncbi:hypothetical protein [Escherichia coli]|uniref:hypothetical protein n=1 Tax=Escherichia coli TaxID=562 RepID=UPI001FF45F2B|nr:hypothetical protein [Escherichia coli]MCJ8393212.1 hypothetical protein [Escherichia coli]
MKTITYLSDTGCLEIQGASLVSQPVPGEQETDITDGIRLSDWYYKYKKSSESNVKDLPE